MGFDAGVKTRTSAYNRLVVMPLALYVAQLGFTEASNRLGAFTLGGCIGRVPVSYTHLRAHETLR